jgi:hypothetical protein
MRERERERESEREREREELWRKLMEAVLIHAFLFRK